VPRVAAVTGILFCATAVTLIIIGESGGLQGAMRGGLPEMVAALLTSLIGGGLVIAGAWMMKRLQAYEFAVITSGLALLPITTFGWPIGLIAGVWALWILFKQEVRAEFAGELRRSLRARAAEQLDGKERVRGPALGLLLAGILHIGQPIPIGIVIFAVQREARALNPLLPFSALSILLGSMILIGAVNLLRLHSRSWARAGAILALLPWGPSWLVSLPAGIWALTVLAAPDVKVAFTPRRSLSS
jgi:hypothetical protein